MKRIKVQSLFLFLRSPSKRLLTLSLVQEWLNAMSLEHIKCSFIQFIPLILLWVTGGAGAYLTFINNWWEILSFFMILYLFNGVVRASKFSLWHWNHRMYAVRTELMDFYEKLACIELRSLESLRFHPCLNSKRGQNLKRPIGTCNSFSSNKTTSLQLQMETVGVEIALSAITLSTWHIFIILYNKIVYIC